MRLFLFTLLFSLTTLTSFAQPKKKYVFGSLGPAAYKGDLVGRYQKWGFYGQLGVQYASAKRLNGSFILGFGFVQGQNSDYTFQEDPSSTPNTYVYTSFQSLSYALQYNIISTESWKVYVSQGLGIARFTTRDEDYNQLSSQLDTRPLSEDYSNISFMLPRKIGVQRIFNNGLAVNFNVNWLNPTTDYLDNISQWGNNSKNDNILTYQIALMVQLGQTKQKSIAED